METRLRLFIGTEQIREQHGYVFPGVKTDNKLKFHTHIKSVHS